MDYENTFWLGDLMARDINGIFLTVFLIACSPFQDGSSPSKSPETGEMMFAISSRENLLIKASGMERITIAWSKGSSLCKVSKRIIQEWNTVRDITADSRPKVYNKIGLDPNQSHYQIVAAFVRRQQDGRYDIRHVEDPDDMLRVAGAIRSILNDCDVEIEFAAVIVEGNEGAGE